MTYTNIINIFIKKTCLPVVWWKYTNKIIPSNTVIISSGVSKLWKHHNPFFYQITNQISKPKIPKTSFEHKLASQCDKKLESKRNTSCQHINTLFSLYSRGRYFTWLHAVIFLYATWHRHRWYSDKIAIVRLAQVISIVIKTYIWNNRVCIYLLLKPAKC